MTFNQYLHRMLYKMLALWAVVVVCMVVIFTDAPPLGVVGWTAIGVAICTCIGIALLLIMTRAEARRRDLYRPVQHRSKEH